MAAMCPVALRRMDWRVWGGVAKGAVELKQETRSELETGAELVLR